MEYSTPTKIATLPDYIDSFICEKQSDINCILECKISDSPQESTLTLTWKPTYQRQYNQQFLWRPRNKSPSKRKRNFERANTWRQMKYDSSRNRDRINDNPNAWSYGHSEIHNATDVSTPAKLSSWELDQDLATPDSGCNTSPSSTIKHSDNYTKYIVEPEFVCEQCSDFPKSYSTKTCCFTTIKCDYNFACSTSAVPDECTSVTITNPVNLKCDTKIVNQDSFINKNSILFKDEDLCLNSLFNESDHFDFCFDRITLAEGPRHRKLRANYGPIIVYMNLLNSKEKYAVSPEILYQESDYHYHWKYHRFETDISRRAYRLNSVKHQVTEMKGIMLKYLKEHNLKFPKQ